MRPDAPLTLSTERSIIRLIGLTPELRMTDRIDVVSIRRAQIVDAACRVINRKGIQSASLAEIEQEAASLLKALA